MAAVASTSGRDVGAGTDVQMLRQGPTQVQGPVQGPARGPEPAVSLSGAGSTLPCSGSATETTAGAQAVLLAKLVTTFTFSWAVDGAGRGAATVFFLSLLSAALII